MICKLCGKSGKTEESQKLEVRKKEYDCCKKCFNKIDKKLSKLKTKKDKSALLDDLKTIKKVGNEGEMAIIIDSREQTPWSFTTTSKTIEECGMSTGDYQLSGFEKSIAVDRKSLSDFISTIIHGGDRFRRELGRMQAMPLRYVFVESTLEDIKAGKYRSKAPFSSIFGIFIGMELDYGVNFKFLNDRRTCARYLVQEFNQVIRAENRKLCINIDRINGENQEEMVTAKANTHKGLDYLLSTTTFNLAEFVELISKPKEFRKALVDIKTRKHKYIFVSQSWADIVKNEALSGVNVNSLMATVARLELEHGVFVKFINDESIIEGYIERLQKLIGDRIARKCKVINSVEKEISKADIAWIV